MEIISCFTENFSPKMPLSDAESKKAVRFFYKKQEIVPLRIVKGYGEGGGDFLQEPRLFFRKKRLTAFPNASTVREA